MENKRTAAIKQDLKKLLRENSLIDHPVSLFDITRDWWPQAMWWNREEISQHQPALVVRPSQVYEISSVLNWANSHGVSVVARGGGSGVCGAAIPVLCDSLVLDMTGLNKTLGIESKGDSPVVCVEAGILGSDLEEALNEKNLSLMNLPASIDISTVGGWIATGSFGQASTLYGGIADQVLKVRAVLPDGSVVEETPERFLFSEGSLGVIVEATLKIRLKPKKCFYASLEFCSLKEGLDFIRMVLGGGIRPAVCRLYDPLETKVSGLKSRGSSFFDEEVRLSLHTSLLRHPSLINVAVKTVLLRKKWLLIMIFEDQEQDYREFLRLARERRLSLNEEAAKLWVLKRNQWNTKKMTDFYRKGCFVDTLDTWSRWEHLEDLYFQVISAVRNLALVMGHVSHFDKEGACVYFVLAAGRKSQRETIDLHRHVWRLAMEAAVKAQALVNHHHGLGLAKLPWKEYAYRREWFEDFATRKRLMDPKGIMNPGKIIGDRVRK